MVTAICLPRLQPLAEDVSASGRPINFPPREKNISLEPWKGFCQTRALIKWKGEFQKPFPEENSTTTRPGFRRDIACKQALHSGVARSHARAARERRRKSASLAIIGELGGIAHVRYIKILTWLRGFRIKIANFSWLRCLAIARTDLSTKKTEPNMEKCQKASESC